MSIELRFYRQRYNMDRDYYTGDKGVYLMLFFPNEESLAKEWKKMFRTDVPYEDHWLEGETYSAWDDEDNLLCGGAFDPSDLALIIPDYVLKEKTEMSSNDWYGIPEMTIEQEINLPPLAKRTLGNKIKIIDWCDNMEQAVKTIRSRAKGTPIKDDMIHSDLVNDWTMKVMQANRLLDDCEMFGRR